MLNKSVIDCVMNKKYTEFSDAVKLELHSKLGLHDDVVQYTQEYDKIQNLKSNFASINKQFEE